jgi:hypothetical protein
MPQHEEVAKMHWKSGVGRVSGRQALRDLRATCFAYIGSSGPYYLIEAIGKPVEWDLKPEVPPSPYAGLQKYHFSSSDLCRCLKGVLRLYK